MRYYDYEWDLEPNRILLDTELNIDKLGWRSGDYFKVVNINGRAQLIKVDPIEKFLMDGEQQKQIVPVVDDQNDTVRFISQEQHKNEVIEILRSKI
jgi:hypothetical protein